MPSTRTTDLQLENDACISDPSDLNVHIEFLVELYWPFILYRYLNDVKVRPFPDLTCFVNQADL